VCERGCAVTMCVLVQLLWHLRQVPQQHRRATNTSPLKNPELNIARHRRHRRHALSWRSESQQRALPPVKTTHQRAPAASGHHGQITNTPRPLTQQSCCSLSCAAPALWHSHLLHSWVVHC